MVSLKTANYVKVLFEFGVLGEKWPKCNQKYLNRAYVAFQF